MIWRACLAAASRRFRARLDLGAAFFNGLLQLTLLLLIGKPPQRSL